MGEMVSQLWTPQMQLAVALAVALLVVLYVLSVVWVIRDAYLRGTSWVIWGIVAIIPLFGVIAYTLMRPPLLQIDRDEQELEVALKQRQLMQYGECGKCGYPVEADYLLCPHCHQRLKNQCPACRHALDPAWDVCPYCATEVPGRVAPAAKRSRRAQGNAPTQVAQPQQTNAPQRRARHAGKADQASNMQK
ncbi:MAG: zinc ribbon domain-containing protein [Eggerthellaceae bacterium]|nr:zinc ribbon domain-containing protein [Eggerthellaceae bacterium]